ncbi:hypothetical protein [Caldalkalibacillus mannanilyticus]|uniref:hypothetical protein n=1 Tax=Caldalkalibacillus mannanilyticus TaxID=1418 RepID=UPI000B244574|nr:hypothetical protein [Caldalkalibacillus mannanilyticus]
MKKRFKKKAFTIIRSRFERGDYRKVPYKYHRVMLHFIDQAICSPAGRDFVYREAFKKGRELKEVYNELFEDMYTFLTRKYGITKQMLQQYDEFQRKQES